MDSNASLNRYAYVQGNPVSLTDPFGLSPDMEYGNYEANALKALYKVGDKVADYLPVVGTARDIKRSYNAFKNGNTADGIKHGATAALSLAVPAAKLATKAMKTTLKLAKNALKAEKCMSKTAEIATEGIRLAGKAGKTGRIAEKARSVSAKIAKSVKNGVSSVARTVKTNAAKVYKKERRNECVDTNIKQIIYNRFPNELQEGKRFNFSIKDGKISLKNGINYVDFVIDLSGNLHLGRGHSYLANGANVQAAGTMKINSQGFVRRITNASGHYAPTVQQAEMFPELLNDIGIRTKNAWLVVGDYHITSSKLVDINKSKFYSKKLE